MLRGVDERGSVYQVERERREWCRWWDSNPHGFLRPQDFKSCASAISPHRLKRGEERYAGCSQKQTKEAKGKPLIDTNAHKFLKADEIELTVNAPIADLRAGDVKHKVGRITMNPGNARKLRDKLTLLSGELVRLELKRDGVIEKRHSAVTVEEKRQCAGEIVAVFADLSDAQRRIDAVKRLLARAEGDEYEFANR